MIVFVLPLIVLMLKHTTSYSVQCPARLVVQQRRYAGGSAIDVPYLPSCVLVQSLGGRRANM